MKGQRVFFFFVCLFFSANVLAQRGVDSLLGELSHASESARPDILLKISEIYFESAPDKAFTYAEQALRAARSGGKKIQLAHCHLSLGKVLLNLDHYNEAFDQFTSGKQLFNELGKTAGEAECLMYMGDVYRENNDYTSALQKYTQSFSLVTSDFGMHDFSNHLSRLGATCLKLGNTVKAEDYFVYGFESARHYKNIQNMIRCQAGIGEVCVARKENDSALSYFFAALRIGKQYNYIPGIIISLNHVGETYKLMGNNKLALAYFTEALNYSESVSDKYHQGLIKSNLGDVFLALKDMKSAVEAFKESQTIAEDLKNTDMMIEDYRKSAKAARSAGNEELAKKYDLLARIIDEGIRKRENEQRLKRVLILYDKEKKMKQYENLQNEHELSGRVLILVTGIATVFLLISALLFRMWWRLRRKYIKVLAEKREVERNNILKGELARLIRQEVQQVNGKYSIQISESLDDLLYFVPVRSSDPQFQPVHVFKLSENIYKEINQAAKERNINITNHVKPDCMVLANERMILAVIRNLMLYGLHITGAGDSFEVSSKSFEPRVDLSFFYPKHIYDPLDWRLQLAGNLVEQHGSHLDFSEDEKGITISFVLETANPFEIKSIAEV